MTRSSTLLTAMVLATASLAAQAATLIETDYPQGSDAAATTPADTSGAAVGIGSGLRLMHSESAPVDEPLPGYTPPSREELRHKTYSPASDDFSYFA